MTRNDASKLVNRDQHPGNGLDSSFHLIDDRKDSMIGKWFVAVGTWDIDLLMFLDDLEREQT